MGMHRHLLVPIVGLAVAIFVLTAVCRLQLGAAAAGQAVPADLSLPVLSGTMLFAIGVVGMLHASRVAQRVLGPEQRLIESLQRLRTGDLSFRVNLRRGDLLTGLAVECNEVLEWLNVNPPRGASTGSDVYEVERLAAEPVEIEAVAAELHEAEIGAAVRVEAGSVEVAS